MTQTLEAPAALPQNTPPPAEFSPFSVIFSRDRLSEALSALAPCVGKGSRFPALACVKLTADADGVSVEATDRELWASRRVESVQVEEVGTILVNHEDLRKAVAALSGDNVTIGTEHGKSGGMVRVRDDGFVHTIEASASEEFPPALKVEGDPAGTVTGAGLVRLVRQTDAARSDLTKPGSNMVMASFWVSAKGDRLRFSASDGRHLHDAFADWNGKTVNPTVLPARLLKAAASMVSESRDGLEVAIKITDGRASFSGSGWELSGPLVEGSPAPVDDIIPRDCPGAATADREDLLRAFKQASTLLNPEAPYLKAAWDAKGLTLSGKQELSRGSVGSLPLRYEGQPITIGLNARNFIDALAAADSEQVTIGLTQPNRPVLIDGGPNFKSVCMPCSLA